MKSNKLVPLGAGRSRIDEIYREVIASRPAALGKRSSPPASCEPDGGESGCAPSQVPIMGNDAIEKPLSMRAFMKASGLTYPRVHALWKNPSFPLVEGLIYWSDFVWWRRRKL